MLLTQEVMLAGARKCAPKNIGGRNAGEEHAGTQGWQRPRQVAMPASRGSFSWFNVVFSSDQRVLVLKRLAALRARSRTEPLRDDCP